MRSATKIRNAVLQKQVTSAVPTIKACYKTIMSAVLKPKWKVERVRLEKDIAFENIFLKTSQRK